MTSARRNKQIKKIIKNRVAVFYQLLPVSWIGDDTYKVEVLVIYKFWRGTGPHMLKDDKDAGIFIDPFIESIKNRVYDRETLDAEISLAIDQAEGPIPYYLHTFLVSTRRKNSWNKMLKVMNSHINTYGNKCS